MINLTRLKLVNFIGVYLGTGLTEFEIDRSRSSNNIILIIGDNGSGKTSIISELTPLPLEHFGSRNESRIIKDKVGIKELDFLVDNFIEYKIKIVYDPTKTTKCFIKKIVDGKEIDLNPNGNVSSYMEILEHELHMKKNYTNVGYLAGSGKNKNFVAMSPTERNNYISEWMPEISEFLDAFKISSKILTKLKKEIESYNKQIGNMSTINYELELNYIDSNINNLTNSLKQVESELIQLETYQEQIKSNVRDYRELDELKNKFINNSNILRKRFDAFVHKYRSIIEWENGSRMDIKELNSRLDKVKQKLSHVEETISFISSELISNQSLLSDDEKLSDTDINTILITIEQNESILESLYESIKEYQERYSIPDEDLIQFNKLYNELTMFIDNLDSKFIHMNNYISMDTIQSMDNLEKSTVSTIENISRIKSLIDDVNSKLTFVNNEIYKYEHGNIDTQILMKRPDFCKNKSCGVIDELMKYLNPHENLKELYDRSKELQSDLIRFSDEKDKYEQQLREYKEGMNLYKDTIDYLYRNNDLISKLPNIIIEMLTKDPSQIYTSMNTLRTTIKDIYEYASHIIKEQELVQSNKDLESLKKRLTTNNQIQDKIDKLNKDYAARMSEKKDLVTELTKLNEDIELCNNFESIIAVRNAEMDTYENDRISLEKMKNTLKIFNKSTYIYNSNENRKKQLTQKKMEIESELLSLHNKRDEMTTFYISKRQIEKMRSEVEDQFNRVNILNKIWSPKVGYPSLKIAGFLNDLTIKTNADMENMWGTDLRIKEFNINASDFSIVIDRDGIEVKDASLCSQGETETINAAISFSIIESNVENGGYDVLRLDEVDGPLDETRRVKFIDMIQTRINELGCDSCFIITHNGEFEDIPCDIIMLKGAKIHESKLKNKNVLFSYS
jgi:DNA repair exonuclease SbcCD ATPase subunit